MTRFTVLLSVAAMVLAIAAMSAGGSGVRDVVDDVIDPELTAEVEGLVERSVLREYAGLDDRTPIPPAPVVVDSAPGAVTGIPGSGAANVGALLFVEDGYLPLTDLDALYGVAGDYGAPPASPDAAAPPVDLIDDTPALVASAWDNPPLDAK